MPGTTSPILFLRSLTNREVLVGDPDPNAATPWRGTLKGIDDLGLVLEAVSGQQRFFPWHQVLWVTGPVEEE